MRHLNSSLTVPIIGNGLPIKKTIVYWTKEEVMKITPDKFIITGGLSAVDTEKLDSRGKAFNVVAKVFNKMRPFKHRQTFAI